MRHAALLLAVFVFGCAKAAPPATPSDLSPQAPDAAGGTNAPVADASAASPEAETAASTSMPAPSTPVPGASSAAPEPMMDECAPVAASFEQSLRPKLKKCWLDAANKKPNERIVGSIKFVVEIDSTGKIASARQVDKSDLPDAVVKCMNKAFKAEKIDTGKCTLKTLTVSEKFPR